jgi:hypothetical protein
MDREMNCAERRFVAYLRNNGYAWQYEPDYAVELGVEVAADTRPDFLVSLDERRCVCEVRQFETTQIRDRLEKLGGYGVLSEKQVYGPLRYALVEKAEQLAPLAGTGVPLVIVLSNPLQADVQLDFHHVTAAMFGNPKWRMALDLKRGEAVGPSSTVLEDYGAFRSVIETKAGREVVNRSPHVSAVATLHQREYAQDFREQMMAKQPARDRSSEAAVKAAFAAMEEIRAAEEAGQIPEGKYHWLHVYELDGEEASPLPREWFAGRRDSRYGFQGDGRYAEVVR